MVTSHGPALVIFTNKAPSPLTEVLQLAGYRVFEALAISEVLNLLENELAECIIVAFSADKAKLGFLKQRCITIETGTDAETSHLLEVLADLFPSSCRGTVM